MNLWGFFPKSLLEIEGIFDLPILAVCLYLYLLSIYFKYPLQRVHLMRFFLLTLVASIILILNLTPPLDNILAPLILLCVIVLPMLRCLMTLYQRDFVAARLWFVATIAGSCFSIGGSVWLFAVAVS